MRSSLTVLLLAALVAATHAQKMQFGSAPSVLPHNLPQAVAISTLLVPTAEVIVTITATSPDVVATPSVLIFPANRTDTQLFHIKGVSLRDAAVNVVMLTTSLDLEFEGLSYTSAYTVLPTCGVAVYAPETCPKKGEWVFAEAEMRKSDGSVSAQVNITLTDLVGFDVYVSKTVNCPSKLAHTGETYNEDYTRLDITLDSIGVSYGSSSIPVRLGFVRRDEDSPCTYSFTVWDNMQTTTVDSKLTCVVESSPLEKCSFSLLPWHIAAIVISCVVLLVIIALIILCVRKCKKSKKDDDD